MLFRSIFNPLDKPVNQTIRDLDRRELLVLAPLILGIIWMGLYPKPVLDRMEPAAKQYIMRAKGGAPIDGAQPITVGGVTRRPPPPPRPPPA